MEQGNGFWKHWFAGFEKGLDKLDEAGADTMLGECRKVCAVSFAAQVFREEWEKIAEMASSILGEQKNANSSL